LGESHWRCVDPHPRGLQGIGAPLGGLGIAPAPAGQQAEFAVIGQGNGLTLASATAYLQRRPENLPTP